MNIRSKLTLQFSLIVAGILLLSSVSIYYASDVFRKQDFYARLHDRATNTARLLIQVQEVDEDLLKVIDRNTIYLPEEEISIYNYLNENIYSSRSEPGFNAVATQDFLNQIRLAGELEFSEDGKECLGMIYTDKYNRFVVVAKAFDKYGTRKSSNLRIVLLIVFLSGVTAGALAGWFYSGQALKPISRVVSQVDKISISSMDARVDEGNRTDEIALMAITFNKMLDRLQSSFELQKSFVANASHELRTPLTSLTGQLEVSLMKDRKSEEYKLLLQSLLEDIRHMNALTNGLLDMAHANQDVTEIIRLNYRIDDMVWAARSHLIRRKELFKINVQFLSVPEDESQLLVMCNDHLMQTAFINLMDNACKFSANHTVDVTLDFSPTYVLISFVDNGPGIDGSEAERIFEPFYRAEKTKNIKGHGLGLPLTKRIVELHGGHIKVVSSHQKGTTLTIQLPLANPNIAFIESDLTA